MGTVEKLIEDIECEIDILQKKYEREENIYYYAQIDAYTQVLSRLKGM